MGKKIREKKKKKKDMQKKQQEGDENWQFHCQSHDKI